MTTTEKAFRTVFSAFVVILIIAPVPPTSIIGVALMTHPKTSRFMHPLAVVGLEKVKTSTRVIVITAFRGVVKIQTARAKTRA